MLDITVKAILDKLPVAELEQSLTTFLAPVMSAVPDRCL